MIHSEIQRRMLLAATAVLCLNTLVLGQVALKTDGSLAAWGDNNIGQYDVPHRLLGNETIAIATKERTNMALKSDGSIVVWGWTNNGLDCVPPGIGYTAINAGFDYGLAVKAEETVCEPLVGDISSPAGEPDCIVD